MVRQEKNGNLQTKRSIVKMEVDLKVNLSEIVTKYTNSSNTTTEAMSVEETFKWTDAEIARLIQIIFRPILIVAGTVGNGLTIFITRKKSLKHLSTCFYMCLLALADSSKWTLFSCLTVCRYFAVWKSKKVQRLLAVKCSGGFGEGRSRCPPPYGPKFLSFHGFFQKILFKYWVGSTG